MAELDGLRIAAMFAADAHLQRGSGVAPLGRWPPSIGDHKGSYTPTGYGTTSCRNSQPRINFDKKWYPAIVPLAGYHQLSHRRMEYVIFTGRTTCTAVAEPGIAAPPGTIPHP